MPLFVTYPILNRMHWLKCSEGMRFAHNVDKHERCNKASELHRIGIYNTSSYKTSSKHCIIRD